MELKISSHRPSEKVVAEAEWDFNSRHFSFFDAATLAGLIPAASRQEKAAESLAIVAGRSKRPVK